MLSNCEAGARWLLDPDHIYDMITDVVKGVDKPVTVNMHMGWDHDYVYVIEDAKVIEAGGVQAFDRQWRYR